MLLQERLSITIIDINMKIELVTFLEAIDNKIALLNHNDLLTAEVTMCLFFPKGGKAKYGNKDFKNRLRIVASSIKSNGCYDRKYVNALVPCEFCGELIEVRLSYSQLFNRRGLHKANHRRLTPYQGSLRDRHEISPDQWDCFHHSIHGTQICCQKCYDQQIQEIISQAQSFYSMKDKTVELLQQTPIKEIPHWWLFFFQLDYYQSELIGVSLNNGWTWKKTQINSREVELSEPTTINKPKDRPCDHTYSSNSVADVNFFQRYYTPIDSRTYKKLFLPHYEEHLHELCKLRGIDQQLLHDRASFMPYKDYLMTPLWRIVSSRVKFRKGECDICGGTKDLEIHHKSYKHLGIEFLFPEDLACLCHKCHDLEHKLMSRGKK